jgi:hypothetical protein
MIPKKDLPDKRDLLQRAKEEFNQTRQDRT